MWADLIIVGSVFAAIIAALDLLISTKSRQIIADKVVVLWDWLDRAKAAPILQWVEKHHAMGWMTAIGALFLIATLEFIDKTTGILTLDQVGYLAAIASVACLLGLYTISYVIHAKTLFQSFMRISLLSTIAVLPFLVSLSLTRVLPAGYTEGEVFYQELWLLFFISSALIMGLYGMFWLVIALPLAGIYFATALLYSSEYVMAQISGYPKRPMAVAGVLIALATAGYKMFSA